MHDQPTWPHVCERCDSPTTLYDSQTRYEDDCHAQGYHLYMCLKCGHFNFQEWETGDPSHDLVETF